MLAQELGVVATLVAGIVALSGVIVWAVKFLATQLVDSIRGLREDVSALEKKHRDFGQLLHDNFREEGAERRAILKLLEEQRELLKRQTPN